jgi:hypothetical protein
MKVMLMVELMMMGQYHDEIVTNQDQGQQLLLLIHLDLFFGLLTMKMLMVVEEVEVEEEIKIPDHQMPYLMTAVHDQRVHY